MKLLVTGITGHTGKWFLKALEENRFSDEVHVIVRPTSNTELIDKSPVNIVKHVGDVRDKAFLLTALKGIDTVVHIHNIKNSLDILEAAVHNGVDWFIGVHTTGMYSNYKSASEEYINIEKKIDAFRDKINVTILRPTMIYGSSMDHNMYKLIKFVDKSPVFPMFGNGRNLMQPVHARDLGYAYYSVLERPEITKNESYNLPGKYAISYKELVQTVADELGKKIRFIHIPIGLSYAAASVGERVPGFPIGGEQVLRMKEDKNFTYQRARDAFGYRPLSFDEGIKEEVQEYLEKKGEAHAKA